MGDTLGVFALASKRNKFKHLWTFYKAAENYFTVFKFFRQSNHQNVVETKIFPRDDSSDPHGSKMNLRRIEAFSVVK